jgi:hypothetical protein
MIPGDQTLVCQPSIADDFCYFKFKDEVWAMLYSKIEMDKSPGSPFVNAGFRTNGDIPQEMLRRCVEERLTLLHFLGKGHSTSEWDLDQFTSEELVAHNAMDPVKVHVKSELTKLSKVARLIFGHSVIDRLIWQWLFFDLLNDLPQRWKDPKNASSVGINFNEAGALIDLFQRMQRMKPKDYHLASDDVRGWEFLVLGMMMRAALEVYAEKCGRKGSVASVVLDAMIELMTDHNAVLAFSDGELWTAEFVFMLSGWLLTHIINTVMRAALAMMVCFKLGSDEYLPSFDEPFQKANGDDCFGYATSLSAENYRRLGFYVTPEMLSEMRFSFCSQIFDVPRRTSYPESVMKIVSNYTFNLDELEQYFQIREVLRSRPDADALIHILDWLRLSRLVFRGLMCAQSSPLIVD